jgi:hypothetical protein
VWRFVSNFLKDSANVSMGLDALIEQERKEMRGDLCSSSNSWESDWSRFRGAAPAHSSDKGTGLPCLLNSAEKDCSGERSACGSTPKAFANLRNVPKCGREILPASIPDTVVGLTPASSASRTCVHICLSRMKVEFVPAACLSMTQPLSLRCLLYHKTVKFLVKCCKAV